MTFSKTNMQRHTVFIALMAIILLAAISGTFVALRGIGYRELIVILGLLLGIVSLFGEQGIRNGYIIWILMFALGYRTIPLTSVFKIHPLTVGIMWLFVLWLIRIGIVERKPLNLAVPKTVWLFSVFWAWGLVIGTLNEIPFDVMFSQVLNFIVIIPIFAVSNYVFAEKIYVKRSIITFFGITTFIAFLGILEFFFPNIQGAFSGYISDTSVILTATDFARAPFSFFGNPSATFLCTLSLPLVIPLWYWEEKSSKRLLLISATCLLLIAVYIGGARSMWIALGLTMITVVWVQNGLRGGIIATILLTIVIIISPSALTARLNTVTSAAQGDYQDTSAMKRASRIEDALQLTIETPWGQGWGASGWVHNDFLQLAADTGLASALIFGFWYMTNLIKLVSAVRTPYIVGLLGTFFIAGILFVTNPVYVLTFIALPIWYIWALVDQVSSRKLEYADGSL